MRRRIDKRLAMRLLIIAAIIASLPMIWIWTPLNRWLNFQTIMYWQETVKNYPGAFFFVMGIFLVGSLVLFPMSILNVATIITFGPIWGNIYSLIGWLLSATMGFAIGRAMGHDTLRKIVGSRLDLLVHRAGRHGFLTVLTIRVLPVAPFTVGNLFVGSSGIHFRDFIAASTLGRIPGMILMTLAGVQIENALRHPAVGTVVVVVVVLIGIPLATAWVAKRVKRSETRRVSSAS
jgi:phospholipase D1/2